MDREWVIQSPTKTLAFHRTRRRWRKEGITEFHGVERRSSASSSPLRSAKPHTFHLLYSSPRWHWMDRQDQGRHHRQARRWFRQSLILSYRLFICVFSFGFFFSFLWWNLIYWGCFRVCGSDGQSEEVGYVEEVSGGTVQRSDRLRCVQEAVLDLTVPRWNWS